MPRRGEVLEMAVLGLLRESPMHGYELRKRLNAVLGWGRALSYGSLYPCLKALQARGDLVEDASGEVARAFTGRRARIVYRLTEAGERRFADLLADGGPSTWEDERFGVHFAFFGRTDVEVRLRILEGRRRRLEERLARVQDALQRTQERLDHYTLELHQHDLESVEREVRWLDSLISTERLGERASEARGAAGGVRTARGTSEEPNATSTTERLGSERLDSERPGGERAGTERPGDTRRSGYAAGPDPTAGPASAATSAADNEDDRKGSR